MGRLGDLHCERSHSFWCRFVRKYRRMQPEGTMNTQTSLAQTLFLGCANREPGLDEMFADPIVKSLMSSDHVARVDVERLLQSANRQDSLVA
jgi:hypothetical protein